MGSKERREREKEQRKAEIIDAARDLLLEKGLGATSINQIAKRSELSVGTIYFYYKSKEELYANLQIEGLNLLHENAKAAIEKVTDPLEKIRSLAATCIAFSNEHKDYYDIINYFLSAPAVLLSPELKQLVDLHAYKIMLLLSASIDEGIGKGLFRKVNATRYAILLWSSLYGLMLFRKLEGSAFKSNGEFHSLYEEAVEHFIKSIKVTK